MVGQRCPGTSGLDGEDQRWGHRGDQLRPECQTDRTEARHVVEIPVPQRPIQRADPSADGGNLPPISGGWFLLRYLRCNACLLVLALRGGNEEGGARSWKR